MVVKQLTDSVHDGDAEREELDLLETDAVAV